MNWHPLCDRYRPMTTDEYADLRDSIRKVGCLLVPIVTLDGVGIDGRHRYRACEELGIAPSYQEYSGPRDEFSLIEYLDAINHARRQVDPEAMASWRLERDNRRVRLEKLLALRGAGKSTRMIAEELGVSKTQIIEDLKKLVGQGCPTPAVVTTRAGQTYPAKRPPKRPTAPQTAPGAATGTEVAPAVLDAVAKGLEHLAGLTAALEKLELLEAHEEALELVRADLDMALE